MTTICTLIFSFLWTTDFWPIRQQHQVFPTKLKNSEKNVFAQISHPEFIPINMQIHNNYEKM